MKPIAGLNRDVNPIDQPQDTMRYAANGVLSEDGGLAQNIRDEKIWEEFGTSSQILGWSLGIRLIYVWIYNDIGQGEIWRFDPDDDLSKELVIIDPSNILALDIEATRDNGSNKFLQIAYQQDFEEGEVFAWAGQTKPKILDVGTLESEWLAQAVPLPVNLDGSAAPPATLAIPPWSENDFFLFPEGQLFNPDITAVDTGGNVFSGAWMFVYRYVYDDGAVTSFSGVSNPVYITEDSFAKEQTFQGDVGNRPTTKSIKIRVNVDQSQRTETIRIQFGYISIRAGVIYAGIIDSKGLSGLLVSAANAEYIYTGEQPGIDLGDDISELITPKALYNKAGTITTLTSRLYVANLSKQEEVNIQNAANAITSEWIYQRFSSGDKGMLINSASFGAGEVYALYISVLYDNGSESRAFHIPGRKYVAGDDTDIGVDPEIAPGTEKWQLYDTVTGVGAGTTGYWVNEGENYPNLPEFDSAKDPGSPYPDKVRHHKMPSIGYLMEIGPMTNAQNDVPSLSLELSNIDLSSLSPEQNVIGYNIYYAKRKIGELVNFCYDWPLPVGAFPNGDTSRVAISGGYGYSDQDPAAVPTNATDVVADDTMMKFHALFLLDTRPAIQPMYFVKEAYTIDKLITTSLVVDSEVYTNLADAEVTLGSAYKYGSQSSFGIGEAFFSEVDRYVAIEDFAYVKNGVKWSFESNSLDNNAGEDAFVVYNENGFSGSAPFPLVKVPLERFGVGAGATMTYVALRTVPSNISAPFDNQVLTFAGSFEWNDAGAQVSLILAKHGDTYNGMTQFNTTGVAGMGPDELAVPPPPDPSAIAVIDTTTDEAGMFNGEGSKMVYIVNNQSPINHVSQYADGSDIQSLVAKIQGAIGTNQLGLNESLPFNEENKVKLKSWYFWDQDIYQSFTFYYNDDFHQRSEYFIRGINDGYFKDDTLLPTTLAFSLQQPTSVQIRQWRNWLLLNKYVQPSEKGEIINLKGAGNQMLYIHHRYTLYTTKDRLTLEGGSTNVTLGSGDIFAVTPYEVVSVSEGHTGLQNRHWQTLSPFGYSWVQTDHGKIYSHDGQKLEELSGYGMRIFFRDNADNDLGYQDNRCMIINDDLKRRIIVGFGYENINSDDELVDGGYTIAFSTQAKAWSFFQTRNLPMPIVSRDKNVFAIIVDGTNDNKVLKVAAGIFDVVRRPFILEATMNDGNSAQKYLQWVSWNSNVWDADSSNTHFFDNENITFNKIVVYSDTKIYGLPGPIVPPALVPTEWDTNLIPYVGFPKGAQNTRRTEDNWFFNAQRNLAKIEASDPATPANDRIEILRERVDMNGPNANAVNTGLAWDEKSRMRDKYLIVRLFFDAENNKQIDVENIEFGVKPSFR